MLSPPMPLAPSRPPPRVWLPELAEHIVRFLPPNEVPCTIRLLDHAAAVLFSEPHHKRILLSQPVPRHAYAHEWCAEGALKADPCSAKAFRFAVRSLSVPRCQWLRRQGCAWDVKALEIAAACGDLDMTQYLVSEGAPGMVQAPVTAARHGHAHLAWWLLQRAGPHVDREAVLLAAAEGCLLQPLTWLVVRLGDEGLEEEARRRVVAAARDSTTPDAREKMEWLVAEGYPPMPAPPPVWWGLWWGA